MKFLVAFVALVAVASAGYTRPSILPAMVEQVPAFGPGIPVVAEDHPAVGPVLVEHEYETPAFGPALIEHEYETPAFGPALIDFPINAEDNSPVVVGPVPEGASPLVQIIVNVARAEGAAEASVPAIKPVRPSLPSLIQPRAH